MSSAAMSSECTRVVSISISRCVRERVRFCAYVRCAYAHALVACVCRACATLCVCAAPELRAQGNVCCTGSAVKMRGSVCCHRGSPSRRASRSEPNHQAWRLHSGFSVDANGGSQRRRRRRRGRGHNCSLLRLRYVGPLVVGACMDRPGVELRRLRCRSLCRVEWRAARAALRKGQQGSRRRETERFVLRGVIHARDCVRWFDPRRRKPVSGRVTCVGCDLPHLE